MDNSFKRKTLWLSSLALLSLTLMADPALTSQEISDKQLIHQQERQKALQETLTPEAPDIRLLPARSKTGSITFTEESLCFNISQVELLERDKLPWYIPLQTLADQAQVHCLGSEGINVLMTELQNRLINYGYITTRVVAPEQDITSGKLIDVNDLMNNFKSGVNKKDYFYLNLLENSPIATDKDISKTFMHHINNGNLPSQYYYILGHGNPDILAGYNGSGAPIRYLKTSMQLLKSDVQSKGYNTDKTIIFLACHLGNGVSSFAELFSQLPDVGTVYAFTGFGWFGGTRPFWTAAGYNVSYKETDASGKVINTTISVYSKSVKGYWRIFNSATAVIKS